MRRPGWKQVRGKWQPVVLEEQVLKEIVWRLWYQAKIKMWRVRERIPGVGALSTAGIPDLIGFVPFDPTRSPEEPQGNRPLPLFIEVKRPGGVHRLAQEQFIAEAKRGGCAAFFAESWDDVVRELGLFEIKLKGGS